MAGRLAFIKMIALPKFLYLFHNIPIPLTNAFFQTLNTNLIRLTWGDKKQTSDRLEIPHVAIRERQTRHPELQIILSGGTV